MTNEELGALDLAVAKAEGVREDCHEVGGRARGPEFCPLGRTKVCQQCYRPTRDPAEAMRLLEKYELRVQADGHGGWFADAPGWKGNDGLPFCGPTPAIAICRAVVSLANKSGAIDK